MSTTQSTFTATITDAQDNWFTIKIYAADSLAAIDAQDDYDDIIWLTTNDYTLEGESPDFDAAQFVAHLTAAFAADGWTVVDWIGSDGGDSGAIVGATVVKS